MASTFFKKFAIENDLTVDYGYTFGKYQDFYISVKEGVSYKILNIATKLGSDVELLKKILSVFNETLEKYCLNDYKIENDYIQFTFNLTNDKAYLVKEFFDLFIKSCNDLEVVSENYCPLCNKIIEKDKKVAIINFKGNILPAHDDCLNKKKEIVEKEINETDKQINKNRSYKKGVLGAIIFSVIYMIILTLVFYITQVIINAATSLEEDMSASSMAITILQYVPSLFCLSSVPLIYTGYELFKGRKGAYKYVIIVLFAIVSTLIGLFLGFGFSLMMVENQPNLGIFSLIGSVYKTYPSFRRLFVLYFVFGLLFTACAISFKFSDIKEQKEANISTIEKLK